MMDEYDLFLRIVWERKEQRKEEGRRKGGRNRNEEIPPLFYNETRSVFLFRFLYISSCHFITLHLFLDVNSITLRILGFFSSCSLPLRALFYFSFRLPWVR